MRWNSQLVILFLLNLFDGVLTLYAVLLGVLEVNPIMNYALQYGAVGFLSIKVGLVTVCLLILNITLKGKQRRLLNFLILVYALVAAWHIFGVIVLHGLSPSNIQQIGSALERGHEFSLCYLSAFCC